MPKYMFNNTYYLRRTKMVVYQLCCILLAVSAELADAAANRYEDRRDDLVEKNPGLSVDVSDIVTIGTVEKAVGGVVGVVFGAALLFDLLWPERRESKVMSWIWKLSAVFGSLAQLGLAIYATFVIVTGEVEIMGQNREVVEEAWSWKEYRESPLAIVSVAIAWLSLVIVVCGYVGSDFCHNLTSLTIP